MIRKLQW